MDEALEAGEASAETDDVSITFVGGRFENVEETIDAGETSAEAEDVISMFVGSRFENVRKNVDEIVEAEEKAAVGTLMRR